MKWEIKSNQHISNQTIQQIIQTLLINRGLQTKKEQDAFLNPSLRELEKPFFDTRQLKKALERIKKAIANREQIIIYSDYDVDGITGSAILWETLHGLGAHVMPFVPDRFKHGYRLSEKGIGDLLVQFPKTTLVITVDNGITAVKQVALLNRKGIDTIIPDHHTVPKKKPNS